MNGMFLKATKSTPLVVLDPVDNCFVIIGNSMPENAADFYGPVIRWLDRNAGAIPKGAIFRFRLNYFSTSSMKALFQILAKLREINVMHASALQVKWHVEEQDDFMADAGNSMSDLIDIPFTFVQENEHGAMADTLGVMQRYACHLAA